VVGSARRMGIYDSLSLSVAGSTGAGPTVVGWWLVRLSVRLYNCCCMAIWGERTKSRKPAGSQAEQTENWCCCHRRRDREDCKVRERNMSLRRRPGQALKRPCSWGHMLRKSRDRQILSASDDAISCTIYFSVAVGEMEQSQIEGMHFVQTNSCTVTEQD
jgi:hypothetical protein